MKRNYGEEELQWKVVDLEVPADIMPVKTYKEEERDRKMTDRMAYLNYMVPEVYETDLTKVYQEDQQKDYYEHSDIKPIPKLTEIFRDATLDLPITEKKSEELKKLNNFVFAQHAEIIEKSTKLKKTERKIHIRRFRICPTDLVVENDDNKEFGRIHTNRENAFLIEDSADPEDEDIKINEDLLDNEESESQILKAYFRGNFFNKSSTSEQRRVRELISNYVFGASTQKIVQLHKGTHKFRFFKTTHRNNNFLEIKDEDRDLERFEELYLDFELDEDVLQ